MDERYLVPAGSGEDEYVEKKSRFIGRVWRVNSEEEAMAYLAQVRTKERDARHNVWAYMLHSGAVRCSDDGEPQGTGGVPVLDVFRKRGVTDFCCVVTRYFGGILLGAGGLVRAYSKAAVIALDDAGIATMRPLELLRIKCSYGQYDRLKQELSNAGCDEPQVAWTDVVTMDSRIPAEDAQGFAKRISDMTAGTVTVELLGKVFDAIPDKSNT